MELKPEDLKIDVFHATRPGGWSTAQPIAVSILHKPSGIIVTKQDERSVHKNKAAAYADLCEAVAKYEAIANSLAPKTEPVYSEQLLDLAFTCGGRLSGKPNGSEPIEVIFTIDAWRKFDLATREFYKKVEHGSAT